MILITLSIIVSRETIKASYIKKTFPKGNCLTKINKTR